ncbi:phage GP46 family protein [Mesorhizobium sp. KR1-2]|uniref:phage GP46 family protein n=1 Tax=Mesorhizobium sp. KR1-2 TaxID=3156609 RepID=UPI0032B42433
MLSMVWNAAAMGGDVEISAGNLADDDTLRTAILVSLFTDRRAGPDDELPDGAGNDRRGWLGDALSSVEGDRIGSRLWLLKRRKQTEETRRQGEDYCREALEWLVEDGIASAITIEAAWARSGVLVCHIAVSLPNGSDQTFTYSVAAASV